MTPAKELHRAVSGNPHRIPSHHSPPFAPAQLPCPAVETHFSVDFRYARNQDDDGMQLRS